MERLTLTDLFPAFEEPADIPCAVPARKVLHHTTEKKSAQAPAPARRPRLIRQHQVEVSPQPIPIPAHKRPATPEDSKTSTPTPEKPPAPPSLPDLNALRAKWKSRWQERKQLQFQQALKRAREEGFQAGYAQAKQEMENQVQETLQRFVRGWEELQAHYEHFVQSAEPTLAQLSFDIATAILQAPPSPEIRAQTQSLLTETLEKIAQDFPVNIYISAVDYLALQETQMLTYLNNIHPRLNWHPDPHLHAGEWKVETPEEVFRRRFGELLDTLRQELGLSSNPPTES